MKKRKFNSCFHNRDRFKLARYSAIKYSIPRAADHAYLSLTSNATIESTEWNDLLLGYHILEISVCLANMQTLNSDSRLVSVLEVHTKIRASCFTRLCRVFWIGCVPSHLCVILPTVQNRHQFPNL